MLGKNSTKATVTGRWRAIHLRRLVMVEQKDDPLTPEQPLAPNAEVDPEFSENLAGPGRDKTWSFRARPDLVKQVIALARKLSRRRAKVSVAALMEEAMELLLANYRQREPSDRMKQLVNIFAAVEAAEAVELASGSEDSEKCKDLYVSSGALSESVFATPARTFSDLQERAVIARHCHAPVWLEDRVDNATVLPERGRWTKPTDCNDWRNRCVAELIDAVLKFRGGTSTNG
jgi:hypothetical protein